MHHKPRRFVYLPTPSPSFATGRVEPLSALVLPLGDAEVLAGIQSRPFDKTADPVTFAALNLRKKFPKLSERGEDGELTAAAECSREQFATELSAMRAALGGDAAAKAQQKDKFGRVLNGEYGDADRTRCWLQNVPPPPRPLCLAR